MKSQCVQGICYNSSSQLSFRLLTGLNLLKGKRKTGLQTALCSSKLVPHCLFCFFNLMLLLRKNIYNLKLNCRLRPSKPIYKRSPLPCFFLSHMIVLSDICLEVIIPWLSVVHLDLRSLKNGKIESRFFLLKVKPTTPIPQIKWSAWTSFLYVVNWNDDQNKNGQVSLF